MDPDALDRAARLNRARLVYTLPNLQNPTGTVLTDGRRDALVEVARRHGLAIVEDDTYGFLLESPLRPLASRAPECTWFVSSTSKALAPGLRIGYLAVPTLAKGAGGLLDRVSAQIAAVGWMAAPLMGDLTTRWIDDGTAERIVASKRAEVGARRALFDAACGEDATVSHQASCHVWVPIAEPWRGAEVAARAREAGVALASSEAFAAERAREGRAVRVCIGTPATRAACRVGVQRLASVLAGAPASLV